jgi:hypothetical protein
LVESVMHCHVMACWSGPPGLARIATPWLRGRAQRLLEGMPLLLAPIVAGCELLLQAATHPLNSGSDLPRCRLTPGELQP